MNTTEQQLRETLARNLSEYRKISGFTQFELAEKLNYSDKSISKWERGDGLPDLFVAVQIAEIFGISLNDLTSVHKFKKPLLSRNKIITTFLSIGIVWLAAALLFFLFQLVMPSFGSEILFIYAIPVSCIVAIVFTKLWWKKIWQFISVSLLIWSVSVCVVISVPAEKVTLIFIIAAVLQVLTILWFLMKR